MRRVWFVALVAVLAAGSACSVSPGDKINVTLDEWSLKVDPGQVRSGRVRFEIDSVGEMPHDLALVLAKSVDEIPRTPEGKLDFSSNRPIDEIEAFEPGHYSATSPNLLGGQYILLCTLTSDVNGQPVEHLAQGMWTKLTVVARKK